MKRMKRSYKAVAIISVIIFALCLLAATKPSKVYDKAQTQLSKGNYEKAAELFDSISSYEDASLMSMYCKAMAAGESGNYDEANKILTFLGDFKDSTQLITYYSICELANSGNVYNKIKAAERFDAISAFRDSSKRSEECRATAYSIAVNNYQQGEYETAQGIFEELDNYNDSSTQVTKCRIAILDRDYAAAVTLKEEGRYREAIAAFQKLSGYKDSTAEIEACETAILDKNYEDAVALMSSGKYEEAITAFEKMNGYRDSKDMTEKCQTAIMDNKYEAAVKLSNSGKYEEAITAFEELNGYKDSKAQITACQTAIKEDQYQQAVALNNSGQYKEAYALFASLPGYKDADQIIKTDENIISAADDYAAYLAQFDVGKTVLFGNYEQDNEADNGKEEIEWIVLAKEDNKAMLISKYILDAQRFNSTRRNMTWANCSLRSWLNNSFLNDAFSVEEQKQVFAAEVKAHHNKYKTDPGTDTVDRVFLLSFKEAKEYFSTDSERVCRCTKYAYTKIRDSEWWLRSPDDEHQDGAALVLSDGRMHWKYQSNNGSSEYVNYTKGIRPVMWLNISTDFWIREG